MGAGDSKAEGGKRATPLLAAAAADDDDEEEEEEAVVEGEGGESGADVAARYFDADFDDEALRFNDLKSSGVFKTLP